MRDRIKRFLKAGVLVSFLAIVMSGCGAKEYANSEITKAFQERTTENIAQLDKLKDAGFITQEERDKWANDIMDHTAAYVNDDGISDSSLRRMLNGVSWINTANIDSGNDFGLPWEEVKVGLSTQYFYNGVNKSDWASSFLPAAINSDADWKGSVPGISSAELNPIPIVDTQTASDINERFQIPIYVLKADMELNDVDSYTGLDGIIEMVQQATADPSKIDESILANYFQDSGEVLLDLSNDTAGQYKLIRETTENTNASANGLGKDIMLQQYGLDAISIRVIEFNPDVINLLMRLAGSGNDKYVFCNGKLYLMEYPVYGLSLVERVSDTEYNTKMGSTGLFINLKNKTLIKKQGDSYKTVDMTDSYLTFNGAANNDAESQSSFIIWGSETKLDVSLQFKDTSSSGGLSLSALNQMEEIEGGYARIVLRDYLEGSYAPGLIDNENVVVFGRKIRINQFGDTEEGTTACSMDEPFAYYITKEGKKNSDLPNIYVDEIADKTNLEYLGTQPKVSYIQRGNLNKDTEGMNSLDESQLDEGLKTSLQAISELKFEAADVIAPVIPFPGNSLGKADNFQDNKQKFFVITVTKGFFDTALYSDWINSSNLSESLTWWNQWLTDHGFSYNINLTLLEDLLMGNYSFELNQQGIIILDLETIAKIQQEYEEADMQQSRKTSRTVFIVLGWAMIAMSLVYMAAWAVDTNIDMGFNILEKISFGHWIAVKSSEEMPERDYEGRSYITFSNLFVKCGILVVVGLILIFVPVTNIAVTFMKMFGGLADIISNLITGL